MTTNISWAFTTQLDDVPQLFYGIIKTNYQLKAYACSCGNTHVIIGNNQDLDNYICEECGNENYLDTHNNAIWYEPISNFLSDEILENLPIVVKWNKAKQQFNAQLIINVPQSIDLAKNEIIFSKKPLCEFNISSTETKEILYANFGLKELQDSKPFYSYFSQSELINKHKFLSTLKPKILNMILNYNLFSLRKNIKCYCTHIEHIEFFIKQPYLKEFEFYKWKNLHLLPKRQLTIKDALEFVLHKRTEKSLKKAVFDNYKLQIEKYDSYNPLYHNLIAKYILDPNIATRMASFDFYKHFEDRYYNTKDLSIFMKYLIKHYTFKQIENLFISYSKQEIFWLNHTSSIFAQLNNEQQDNLDKIKPCRYNTIHDEIVAYHRVHYPVHTNKEFKYSTFQYDENQLKGVTTINPYKVKLPQHWTELSQWSLALNNCLSSYWNKIQSKQSTVYGFFIDDEIKIAVEISNNKIMQAKSRHNKNLNEVDMSLVLEWFEKLVV